MKDCIQCGTTLLGKQKKFCSNKCKCIYRYKNNPDRYPSTKEGMKIILSFLKKGNEIFELGTTDNNLEGLNKFNWRFSTKGYIISGVQFGSVALHRVIWEYFNTPLLKGQQIDHINRDKLDNRLCNLRVCLQGQNSANVPTRKNKKNSKYKGVHQTASGKWQAQIWFNNKNHGLGSFDTEKEAALAYNKKASEIQGEFAYQNIIN
jgi:hypothetical protein